MATVRVYQLARELGLDNATLIEKLRALGMDIKNHMAGLSEDDVEQIRAQFRQEQAVKVDEVRLGQNLIRRRRKVEVAPSPTPAEPALVTQPVPVALREEPAEVAPVLEAEEVETPTPAVVETPAKVPGLALEVAPAPPVTAERPAERVPEPASPVQEVPLPPILPSEEREAPAPEYLSPVVVAKEEMPGKPVLKRPVEIPKKPLWIPEEEEREKPGKKGRPALGKKVVEYKPKRAKELVWEGGPDREVALREEGEVRREKKISIRRPPLKPVITVPKPIKRKIRMGDTILVGELAKRMGVKAAEIIKKLMQNGVMSTINQAVDAETASSIASAYGYEIERLQPEEVLLLQEEEEERPELLVERPPVVTIMGHVNHGKTRLLDAIRKTNVMEREAGGITQHIGAYKVNVGDKVVVFLDTPGHEAFTKMRARGAMVTDIVVLVVAADDGVMPQTVEAINHARAAGVPIVVAVNKIDLPDANVDRVKQALTEHKLMPEAWGGDTLYAEISAKEGRGIQELLELILLQAEMLELKANPAKRMKGVIIEARLDRTLGPVATVLVREGTLRVGDPFVTGLHYGKVRALLDDRGVRVSEAGPSIPVEVLGCSGVPEAGDPFFVVEDEKKAKLVSSLRTEKARQADAAQVGRMSLDDLYERIRTEDVKELNIILKADVQGSVEALAGSLERLSTDKVKVKILHGGVGGVTESDVMLAAASNALVIGFNVRAEPKAMAMVEQEKVDVRFYTVIYDAVADVKAALEGMLEPVYKEVLLGRAEVRETFMIPKVGMVAGSYVLEGKIERNAKVRVLRDSVQIHDGRIASLRRFKDDAREVAAGYECGIRIEGFNDVKVGDILESYSLEQVSQILEKQGKERRPG